VVALGIGGLINDQGRAELKLIASSPLDKNVIFVQSFSSLPTVEERLKDIACTGTNTCHLQLLCYTLCLSSLLHLHLLILVMDRTGAVLHL